MSRLRVGCVGTGFIAARHLAALSAFPDVEVAAVADAAADRVEAVAARCGARPYRSGRALLEAEDLDAVWLCVPPSAHGELEDLAVDRGLPVFVEKPLGVGLDPAVRLAERVRTSGLLTAVGYHWRALSVVDRARALVRETPAQLVTGAWLDRTPAAPWWSRRSDSGGQLVEQTTHLVDLARLLVGEVETVQALETHLPRDAFPTADVPTASAVLLRFRSGAVGTLASSCLLPRRCRVGLQLVLDERLLEISERSLVDHELRLTTTDGEEVVTTDEDPVAREDRAFLDAVLGGPRSALVSYEEALRTQAVVCAADRSARSGGAAVAVEELLRLPDEGAPEGAASPGARVHRGGVRPAEQATG